MTHRIIKLVSSFPMETIEKFIFQWFDWTEDLTTLNSSNKFLKYSIKWDYDRPTIRRITRWNETTVTFAIVDVTLHNTYTTETGTLDISCKSRTTTNVSNWRSRGTRKKKREKGRRRGEGKRNNVDTTRQGRVEERWIVFECFTTTVGFVFFFGSIDPWKITLKRSSLLEDNRQLFEIIRTGWNNDFCTLELRSIATTLCYYYSPLEG